MELPWCFRQFWVARGYVWGAHNTSTYSYLGSYSSSFL